MIRTWCRLRVWFRRCGWQSPQGSTTSPAGCRCRRPARARRPRRWWAGCSPASQEPGRLARSSSVLPRSAAAAPARRASHLPTSTPAEWASRSVRTASSKRSSRASVRVMPFTVPAGVTQSGVSRRRTREASLAPNAGQMEVHDLHSPMFPRPASPCSARDRRLSLDAETVQQHLSRCTLLVGQRTGRRLPRRDRSLALTQEQLPLGHVPRVVPPVLPSEPVPRGVRPGRGRALRPDRLRC